MSDNTTEYQDRPREFGYQAGAAKALANMVTAASAALQLVIEANYFNTALNGEKVEQRLGEVVHQVALVAALLGLAPDGLAIAALRDGPPGHEADEGG